MVKAIVLELFVAVSGAMRDDETYILLRAHVKRSYQLFAEATPGLPSLSNANAP